MELKSRFRYGLIFKTCFVFIYFAMIIHFLTLGFSPASATEYDISGQLLIPSIGLNSNVTSLELSDDGLDTPDSIVGSFSLHKNKTLLIGHSSTVFKSLASVQNNDTLIFSSKPYRVIASIVKEKNSISMSQLLKSSPRDTLVLMTCAGEDLGNGDATHRLIVFATAI